MKSSITTSTKLLLLFYLVLEFSIIELNKTFRNKRSSWSCLWRDE